MKLIFPALCWAAILGGFVLSCAERPLPDPNEVLFPLDSLQGDLK